MRENLREQLNTEISRKQFLQYMAGAMLMVFGLNNIISLLAGNKIEHHVLYPKRPSDADGRDGFGSRKFGV